MTYIKYTNAQYIDEFANLARKLGKLPSKREVDKFCIFCTSAATTRFKSFNNLKEEVLKAYPNLKDLTIPVKMDELEINNYRFSLESKENKKFNKDQVETISELDYIKKFAEQVFKGTVKAKPYKSKESILRVVNLIISDTHFGSDINQEETGFQSYGKVEESRRLANIALQVASYKEEHRKNTKLEVLILGDIIEGKLHDAQNGAPISEQCCRAIHLLTQMLAYLSTQFPEINVRFQGGNHSRYVPRHPKRATHQKWDNLETVVIFGVKSACSNLSNVKFHIPKTPFGFYEVFKQKIWYSHGDTVLKPGNPGSSINVKALEQQINKWNASLGDRDEYKVFIVGHVHCASITQLGNGATMITNGALCPPDEFAVSIGISEGISSQVMFESVPGYPVGDVRIIRVGLEHDQDKNLDNIIKPWNNL